MSKDQPVNDGNDNGPDATSGLSGGVAASPESSSIAQTVTDATSLTGNLLLDTDAPIVLNKDGTVRKKPGRKPGQTYTAPAPGVVKAPKSKAEIKSMAVSSETLAKMLINSVVGAMVATVGDEWNFQSKEEAEGILAASTAYIEAKGDGFMTIEVMLGLTLIGYATPRFSVENTRSKLGRFFRSVFRIFKR